MALAATQIDQPSEVTNALTQRTHSWVFPPTPDIIHSTRSEDVIIDQLDEWLALSEEDPDLDTTMLRKLTVHDNIGSTDLPDALQDLHEARLEALQEGFDIPSDLVIQNAELLTERMFKILPIRFEIYPIDGGEIAIQVPGEYGWSMVIFCEAQGTILCMMVKNGNLSRYRSEIVDVEQGDFIWCGLTDLATLRSLRFGTRAA